MELPDFEVLVEMARNDPQGLERLRHKLTNEVIEKQDDEMRKQRLKGLQFQIDMERKRAATPMAAAMKLSEMMCWKLAELNRCFLEPEEIVDGTREVADVVPLHRKDEIPH